MNSEFVPAHMFRVYVLCATVCHLTDVDLFPLSKSEWSAYKTNNSQVMPI